MAESAVLCSNVCKQCTLGVNNNNALPKYIIKGDSFAYNGIPVVDMTIKLFPYTNQITSTYTTELHICKQQHTPTANSVFYMFLLISQAP